MPPPSLSLKLKQVKVKNSNKCKNTNSMAIHERNRAKCIAFLNNWNAISLFNILCIEHLSLNQKVSLTFWCQLLLRYCIALFYEKSTLPPWLLIKDANDVDWKKLKIIVDGINVICYAQSSTQSEGDKKDHSLMALFYYKSFKTLKKHFWNVFFKVTFITWRIYV